MLHHYASCICERRQNKKSIKQVQAICITVFVFSSILLSSLAIAFARPWNGMMDNLKRVDYVKLVLCVFDIVFLQIGHILPTRVKVMLKEMPLNKQ